MRRGSASGLISAPIGEERGGGGRGAGGGASGVSQTQVPIPDLPLTGSHMPWSQVWHPPWALVLLFSC